MLAYVFWHRPREGVDAAGYESALGAFHRGLAAEALEGFHGSAAFAVQDVPWLGGGAGYEDWYLLEASFALDTLNQAAVGGRMEAPHRAAAAGTGEMAAGLFRLVQGTGPDGGRAVWFGKPPGESYDALYERLRPLTVAGASLWRRQMVLGPTPEFCLTTDGPAPGEARLTLARRLLLEER